MREAIWFWAVWTCGWAGGLILGMYNKWGDLIGFLIGCGGYIILLLIYFRLKYKEETLQEELRRANAKTRKN